MPVIEKRIRPYQQPLHSAMIGGTKRAIEIAHRRWGKDEIALTVTCELAHKRVGSYWHCLPEFAQARKAIWTAVNAHTGKRRVFESFPESVIESMNDQEMFIRFKNGSTWQMIGSDRYDSTVGAGVAGITYSEWALANPSAWAYHRPMVEENNGWAMFITTPRGNNHARTMYDHARQHPETWFAEISNAEDTGALSPSQLKESLEEYISLYGSDLGKAQYEQEYLCSFNAAVMGSFYGSELTRAETDKRITTVPWQRGHQVITAWDLGWTDSTAIWFAQIIGQEIHLIDYYEANGQGLDHYADVLKEKGYNYKQHLLPHDVDQHELGSGKSRASTLRALGINPTVVPVHKVFDGVNAARMIMDRCWFDEQKCARGLDALRMYRREWDDRLKVFRGNPLHDWTSHGADAFRYFAAGFRDTPIRSTGVDRYRQKRDSEDYGSAWAI